MCLYPKLIKNRKYIPNKKNKGIIPEIKDKRVLMVPVGCTKCMECMKQKSRAWMVRMQEEIRNHQQGNMHMITLTLSNESYKKLAYEINGIDTETGEVTKKIQLEGYELDNEIATLATRRFLERWRKKYKISIKHWLVTELGHNGTENIHLHGILFLNKYKNQHLKGIAKQYQEEQIKDIEKIWGYGYIYKGDYVNERTVNYITKYITKVDLKHKEYKPIILTSPSMGASYIKRYDFTLNKYNAHGETKETYTTRQGRKMNLPIYYRNKRYSDEERELLWLQKLDKQERWVDGQRIDISKTDITYYEILKLARAKNERLGYGNDKKNWNRINYENERKKINIQKRLATC